MPNRLVLCLTCVLLLLSGLNAQEDKKDHKVLKNTDIHLMTQNHFDDDTLIKVIEVSHTDFDVSSDALVVLMRQGVSSNVLRAMLASVRKNRDAAQALHREPYSVPATAPTSSGISAIEETAIPSSPENNDPDFATRSSNTAAV